MIRVALFAATTFAVVVCCVARMHFVNAVATPALGKLAIAESTVEASHWPKLYGPMRTSIAGATIDTPRFPEGALQVIWSIPIGTGYGSPVVSQNKVVFNHRLGDEDIVRCVEASTGAAIWDYHSANTFECKFAYSSGPYSTPLIHDGSVYVVGGQGQLACLDFLSGAVKWKRELHADFQVEESLFPVGSTPLIVGQHLLFNLGASKDDTGIVALDRSSGETKWRATDHGIAYCTPLAATIHEQPFAFVMTDYGLVSLNPDTGVVDWQIEHHSRAPMTYNATSPVAIEDYVVAVAGPGPGAVCVQVMPDRTYREVKARKLPLSTNDIHRAIVYQWCTIRAATIREFALKRIRRMIVPNRCTC